mmetsp:Transcript_26207/g.32304  ORF Transcript_26207/g.32304 Transcript_26207/m.32304 type:complete len:187 (-) Transcript_26207:704-1264(-)
MPTEEIADSRATYQKALEEKHKKNECGNFAIDLSLCLFDVKVQKQLRANDGNDVDENSSTKLDFNSCKKPYVERLKNCLENRTEIPVDELRQREEMEEKKVIIRQMVEERKAKGLTIDKTAMLEIALELREKEGGGEMLRAALKQLKGESSGETNTDLKQNMKEQSGDSAPITTSTTIKKAWWRLG